MQNLVCSYKADLSLTDETDQMKMSMTVFPLAESVTYSVWEELMCSAPGTMLGRVTGQQLFHGDSSSPASL